MGGRAWLGDLPVAAGSPAGLFFIAPDHLGSQHQITDPIGAVAWLWHQTPSAMATRRARSPTTSAFRGNFLIRPQNSITIIFATTTQDSAVTSKDPIGLAGGINTYAYARNAPPTNVDATGLDSSQPTGTQGSICLAAGTCVDHYVACTESVENAQFSSGFSCGSCLRYCLAQGNIWPFQLCPY